MGRDMQKVYQRTTRWKKKALKRIPLEVRKEYFAAILEPAVAESGESMNGYIKKALEMRMGLSEAEIEEKIAEYLKEHPVNNPEQEES